MKPFRRCPLLTSLMLLIFFSAAIGSIVGSWLVVNSQFFYSASKAISASEKYAGVKMGDLDDTSFVHIAQMIIGILVIVLSVVLLWASAEIYLLVLVKGQLLSCTESYKNQIEEDWSTASMWQRGFTHPK